jgi:hypothetical protein
VVLTPTVPQLPTPGTSIVYGNVTSSCCRLGAPFFTIPGSATLTISQAPPPGVPAPGTLLLIVCGLGGLGLLAPKLRAT